MRPFKVNVYASDFEEAELAAGRKPPSVLAAEAAAAAKAAKKNGTSSGSNTSGNAMPLSFGSSGSGVGGGGNNGMGPTDNASPGSKMTKVARGGGGENTCFHSRRSKNPSWISMFSVFRFRFRLIISRKQWAQKLS